MAHIVVDLPGDTRALAEGRHANRLGAFLVDVGDARTSGPRGFARPVLRVQQRAPRLVRGGAGPAQNESKQGDQRHHQRLETVGATGEPERIASARERREAAVRETLGERPLAAVRAPARAPVEARAGSRAVS